MKEEFSIYQYSHISDCPDILGYSALRHVVRGFFIDILKIKDSMKPMIRIIVPVLVVMLITNFTYAQKNIRGQVSDYTSGQAISGAEVITNLNTIAAVSDNNGFFEIPILDGLTNIIVKHVGYKNYEIRNIWGLNESLMKIELQPEIIGLDEINIISTYVRERESPAAVSTIKTAVIEREMGNQDYPEIMKAIPGVYATKLGGGNGDARISIRGFQQENIALLLNGVPVSSVENGLVYWSNWAGLGDATQTIQIQRGLGASRVALNSVGGTINIITKSSEANRGGSIRYSISDYGNQKMTLCLSSGKLKNNVSLTFLGSRTTGPGYVDATQVDAWAYFLTISKEFNKNQKLVFSVIGSPERHGQRNYGLTNEQYMMFGGRFNPNWGMYNGKINSLSENFYHKPQISLNHYLNLNSDAMLASSAYVSFGDGGGKYSESFMSSPANAFRKNNQIDWDAIYEHNFNNTDTATLENGEMISGFSKIIQTNYLASHIWFGGLTTLNYQMNNNLKLITGLHARYFKSNLREEISDLLGGSFWLDEYKWTIDGVSGRNQIKRKGDIINVDNDSRVDVISYFLQAEYSTGNFTIFLASTLNNTWYRRYDRINYIRDRKSALVSRQGADVKAGLNYNIDKYSKLYFNTGYYSKAPYFNFIFANFSNAVVKNITNEKISSVEVGYNFLKSLSSLNVNLYLTSWTDKSLLSRENIQLENSTDTRALVRGLDAVHKGIELEANSQVLPNLNFGVTASIGDWRWKNDVIALLYNDNEELIDSTAVFVKNIKVGDAPQLTFGFNGELRVLNDWIIGANWMHYGKLYANFDPAGRNNMLDRSQPYRIPDYSSADIHIMYNFKISDFRSTFQMSCFNLMNRESILRGEDGYSHNLDTFQGFWSPGRTFNISLKMAF